MAGPEKTQNPKDTGALSLLETLMNERKLLEIARETANLEATIIEHQKTRNVGFARELGYRRDIASSMKIAFKNTLTVNRAIQVAKGEEIRIENAMRTLRGRARRQAEQLLLTAKQRREEATKELEILRVIVTRALLPYVYILAKTVTLFKSLDTAAWEFRKAMGMTREYSGVIRDMSQDIAIEFMHIGVTAKDVYESTAALGKEMGSVHAVTKGLVATTSILKAQLGIAEDSSAGFFRNMASVAGTTMQAQEDMAYMTAALSQAAGTPLGEIMHDIGKASGTTLLMMSRIPNQVTRAAIELKRMGSSLKEAAASSREILNFTDSVNAEMEASVLLGRSINLQRARELAYRRDLEGSTKEILRITKQIDFKNLDVFQQEAFARATGKTVDELLKMVQTEKQLDDARTNADPKIRKMAESYDKMRAANEATLKSNGENLKLILMQRSNQERLTAITQKWNQLIAKISDIFLPTIDIALGFVADNLEGIVTSVGFIKLAFAGLSKLSLLPNLTSLNNTIMFIARGMATSSVMAARMADAVRNAATFGVASLSKAQRFFLTMSKISSVFPRLAAGIRLIFGPIFSMASKIPQLFGTIGAIFPKLGIFFSTFGKVIPIIGWLITGIQFLKGIFDDWAATEGSGHGVLWRIGHALLAGVVAVIEPIWEMLKWPFVKMWEWFKGGPLAGKSPSDMGMMIVKGIASVGAMLFDALTSPWRRALAWIFDYIPGMGKVAEKLRGGLSEIVNKPLEAKVSAGTPSTITPVATRLEGTPTAATTIIQTASGPKETSSNDLLNNILVAINNLNKNLENGKIGLYVDGQLLSATLARQTKFRGGYGANIV